MTFSDFQDDFFENDRPLFDDDSLEDDQQPRDEHPSLSAADRNPSLCRS